MKEKKEVKKKFEIEEVEKNEATIKWLFYPDELIVINYGHSEDPVISDGQLHTIHGTAIACKNGSEMFYLTDYIDMPFELSINEQTIDDVLVRGLHETPYTRKQDNYAFAVDNLINDPYTKIYKIKKIR